MTESRHQLIKNLADDIEPVRAAGSTIRQSIFWLILSLLYVTAALWVAAPFRPGWLQQLMTSPQFFFEFALGALFILALSDLTMKLGIPAHPHQKPMFLVALTLGCTWIAINLIGLQWPALEASMVGKREHCFIEVLAYSLLPMLLATLALRRLVVLQPLRTGVVLALAASTMPALLMQFACMYDPGHNLRYHIGPMLLVIPLGVLLTWLLAKKN